MNIKYFILFISLLQINRDAVKAQRMDALSLYDQKILIKQDPRKPIFKLSAEQRNNSNRLLRFSVLTGYQDGIKPINANFTNFSSFTDNENGTTRIYMYNLSIQDMLTHGFYSSNRVLLEVSDPSKYRYDPSSNENEMDWLRKNGHCFELLLPAGTTSGDILNKELARVFGVEFGVKKRIVDVLILFRTSRKDKIKTAGKGEVRYNKLGYLNNIGIAKLKEVFYDKLPPIIDETGYTDKVDLDLHLNEDMKLKEIRKALQNYDLDLRPDKREVDMFVITEIKPNGTL